MTSLYGSHSSSSKNTDDSLDEFQRLIENFKDVRPLLFTFINRLKKTQGFHGAVIYLLDESFDFSPAISFPEDEENINFYQRHLQYLVNEGHFSGVRELNKIVPFDIPPGYTTDKIIKSCLLSPLIYKECVLGMIGVYSCLEPVKIPLELNTLLAKLYKIISRQIYILHLKKENQNLKNQLDVLYSYKDDIVTHITDCLLIMDSDFFIHEINRAGVKMFGCNRGDILGKNLSVFLTDESRIIYERIRGRILKESEMRNVELEIKNKVQETIIVNFSAALYQNKKGNPEGIVAVLKDITELRSLIRGLENARTEIEDYNLTLEGKIRERTLELQDKIKEITYLSEFNSAILENMNSGVIGLDTAFQIHTLNKAASSITSINPEECLGQGIQTFPILDPLYQLAKTVLDQKQNISGLEVVLNIALHQETTLSVSSMLLHDPFHNLSGVMLVFADTTMIRLMHQKILESERMAALGRMAASVAHEIRNPLNVIRGLAEIITRKKTDEEKIHKYMTVVIGQIDRLEFLLKEIVDFIKPRSPNLLPYSLHEIIAEVLETFREGFLYFSKKQIEIHLNSSEQCSKALVDRDQFQQILYNLLKNAVDAIEQKGSIALEISEDNEYVQLLVKDDGCGMDDYVKEHASDAFFTTKATKGTGLGLSIVKNIMEGHKGLIEILSNKDNGTSIVLKFLKNRQDSPSNG